MKKLLLFTLCQLYIATVFGQVGIGSTPPETPHIVDSVENDNAISIPRIALSSCSDTKTLPHVKIVGFLLYNIATAADVSPGFYFWSGTHWKKLTDEKQWTSYRNNKINLNYTKQP
jgi:hypothetical protein